jgi:hypothetical protein
MWKLSAKEEKARGRDGNCTHGFSTRWVRVWVALSTSEAHRSSLHRFTASPSRSTPDSHSAADRRLHAPVGWPAWPQAVSPVLLGPPAFGPPARRSVPGARTPQAAGGTTARRTPQSAGLAPGCSTCSPRPSSLQRPTLLPLLAPRSLFGSARRLPSSGLAASAPPGIYRPAWPAATRAGQARGRALKCHRCRTRLPAAQDAWPQVALARCAQWVADTGYGYGGYWLHVHATQQVA